MFVKLYEIFVCLNIFLICMIIVFNIIIYILLLKYFLIYLYIVELNEFKLNL